jgi:mono/diheme cytochrome c family protein
MKKTALILTLPLFAAGIAITAHAITAHAGGDREFCEPARLSGKAAMSAPEQPAGITRIQMREGQGRGMMRHRMGQGRGMMGRQGMMGNGRMGQGGSQMRHRGNPVRHRVVMMGPGVPAPYAGMKNPLPATEENITAGKKLFAENCASCHGATGHGDGEAGRELDPPPANIAFIMDKPIATDGFLMWTISEGGEKLGTAMPAFKEVLKEKERWQLIHYLRTLSQN